MTSNLPAINIEKLYCEQPLIEDAKARINKLKQSYKELFSSTDQVRIFSAPGRTEIGGNHTDHQQGCVLAAQFRLMR